MKDNTFSERYCDEVTKRSAKLSEKNEQRMMKKTQIGRIRRAWVRESCNHVTHQIIDELLDGDVLSLSERYSGVSENVQRRVVRRVVEKRQAQMAHRRVGRSENGYVRHLSQKCASRSLKTLQYYQLGACA